MQQENRLPDWEYVKKPRARGKLKTVPEDFVVEEILGFEPSGEGEHLFVHVKKKGLNTLAVVEQISKRLNVPLKHISYSGLKDKNALTKQWLSIWSPQALEPSQLNSEKLTVISAQRHTQKLKRGAHQANYFEITIRNVSKRESIELALDRIQAEGVPNYFGAQRFGINANNLVNAEFFFAGKKFSRQLRGLYLSAARSFIFNEVLSRRVEVGNWATGSDGDVMMLAGSNSFFKAQSIDSQLLQRLKSFDIHPSAPLWGKGELATTAQTLQLEQAICAQNQIFCEGLAHASLRQQRRATRLVVHNLFHEWLDTDTLKLKFTLTKGAFATTVLRELLTIDE